MSGIMSGIMSRIMSGNHLNHSLQFLNSSQFSSIMLYIFFILPILLNQALHFLNSAQVCSVISYIISIMPYSSSIRLGSPQLCSTLFLFY